MAITAMFVLVGCAKEPAISLVEQPASNEAPNACDRSSPFDESFTLQPSSIRGANIVFVMDDSGSMGDEINKVVENIDAFITGLSMNTQDQLRLVLLFNTRGFIINVTGPTGCTSDGLTVDPTQTSCANGTPFASPFNNPFAAKIDNQKVFYVNEGVGSRGADVALFRAFSQANFVQPIPALNPLDAGGVLQGGCTGPGTYWRPRECRNRAGAAVPCNQESSLSQTATTCYFSPGFSSVSGGTITGPLSHLLPGVAINVVVFSDDDVNVAGGFSGSLTSGRELVLGMMKKVFEPLGINTPLYYHSIVGLQSDTPPGSSGTIDRVGVNHQGLSTHTEGLKADVRLNDYSAVLNDLKEKIIFSEQVVETSCGVIDSITPQVYKDGVLLNSSLYQVSSGSKDVRLLPGAFSEADLDRTIQIRVLY